MNFESPKQVQAQKPVAAQASLHLLKLCVGIDRPEDLASWQQHRALKGRTKFWHTTRMWPRREVELLEGGSLYWVMKGAITCRQPIMALEEEIGADGVRRCRIMLHKDIVLTARAPRRAFQGWRYLAAADAPRDLGHIDEAGGDLPEELADELLRIGVV